ncbi:hypothetical protein IB276_05655 [Ensifer sp. ENS04]|uniref:hypothetical protein n=1 Tax=Ensifer sp. ENS04 TaxID=2769281 RepID=UPI00177C81FA|nr:hypothetical protein [Ensifer sp. ENS04]MBD9538925.1 hypothetical protein [Ensifer sp. ENS04]
MASMRPIPPRKCDQHELGVEVLVEDGIASLCFDLDRIEAFCAAFGEGVFLEFATRYLEEKAETLSAHDELDLWKEAVSAHVTPDVLS